MYQEGEKGVATDMVFADTPAVDDGSTCAQIYVGIESLVTDIYGMKTDKQFVNTLEDNICWRGAMDKLVSDRAKVETEGKVLDLLRYYIIAVWQSEPFQKWNPHKKDNIQSSLFLSSTFEKILSMHQPQCYFIESFFNALLLEN